MCWYGLAKYRLSVTTNLLPMHLHILAGHNFHILISKICNRIYVNHQLLPMHCTYCQRFNHVLPKH